MKKQKETGYSLLKKTAQEYFDLWNKWMKRAQIAEWKVEKLKQLMLLTDPAVSGVVVCDTQIKQWQEFIKQFPDEALEPKELK